MTSWDHRCPQCGQGMNCNKGAGTTAGHVASLEETLRTSKRRRALAWGIGPGGLLLTYLTLLVSHPLGLVITIPLLVAGAPALWIYADGSTVPEARARLAETRADYTDSLLTQEIRP